MTDPGSNPLKRPPTADDSPLSKKVKQAEEPAQYSDAVRKKLASTSRTGQACDRCKERKMKCDTNPVACGPCQSKGLRCYTTDRVTGHARERGQTDRAEGELMYLREQLNAYQTRYGPLRSDDALARRSSSDQTALQVPSFRYVGWPAPDNIEPLCKGPVNGTKVDIMDGIIDVADFDCDVMREPSGGQQVFNASRTSIVSTVFGYQRVDDPRLPSKKEAVGLIDSFLVVMTQYFPVLHRPTFKDLVNRFYDQPSTVSIPERVQVVLALATMTQQLAVRNHDLFTEMYEKSHRLLHYALGFYRDIYHDTGLKAMQALALLVLYCRNLPKPGVTWSFSHQVLVRAIELQYHRDPDKAVGSLPPDERSVLAKELRKRVFHAVLGVCVTTGCRVGLPAPWQFQHLDVPLPLIITDGEISASGLAASRSGQCDYHPANQLSKLIPLLTELYNYVLCVRRPPAEYLKTVEALNNKIMAWRQDWDDCMRTAQPLHVNLTVATLLMDQWAAEYQLTLHHPACCTSNDPQVLDRHLEICHKAARRLLSTFHTLSKDYKGVDFTWHSTGPFAMGFGITLYYYRRRLAPVSKDQFETICNEIKGWLSLVAYADVVMKTNNHLQHIFRPRAQAIENEYRKMVIESSGLTPNSTFQAVNGTAQKSQIKAEPSPQAMSGGRTLNGPSPTTGQPSPFAPPPPTPPFNSAPGTMPGTGQWQQSMSNMHFAQNASVMHGYSTYTQAPPVQMTQSSHPHPDQQYQSIPVSLAPILNNPQAGYASYPNPSQAPTQTAGPSMADYSMMAFSPNHYYDSTGPVSWPLITMPPGQQ
ncbi:uncharacterized protein HMPREF1541_00993 [Cyphellophora europaea CBS 101466]|uniref:Zn(2)-C6 fungal-type domain-containing protein n=1 Tax=Cyphellophora europaea (strain CBS 101466) TaxID=1220924 RepID=W2SFY4_CYPE1|nr:uncharacterized protein HMPREF1541_00993 [Cyphellophora europaea CBS 101466]ETN46804.1 hypothetical protein HMPREF1541_00993 [Cyphellophora europaea CBS 101466]